MIHIGIDPGATGALAALSDAGLFLGVIDAPVMVVRHRSAPDAAGMLEALDNHLIFGEAAYVCLEEQHAFPKNGAVANHSTGRWYGVWEGLVVARQLSLTVVSAVRWKRALGVGSDKDHARQVASRLFPQAPLTLKKHHGRAEALLIAEYGRRVARETGR